MTKRAIADGSPLVYDRVSKSYKTHFWQRPVRSLDDLSLVVEPGEILGVLGPNGAGKTTTIKLALGLIFPESGTVSLMGQPAHTRAARLSVGYLPENPYFPDDLTGRELVELGARLHGLGRTDRRSTAAALLERVGLADALDRPLRKYSKGMVQRAAMARALVGNPSFVILDEPMSGLDPIGRKEFRDMILALRRDGVTVLFASHVLSDAEMLCDRVAIFQRGKLRAVRDVHALHAQRRVMHWEVEVAGLEPLAGGELVSTQGELQLWRFTADFSAEQIQGIVAGAGVRLRALIPYRETLEDLFLRTLDEPDGGPARHENPTEPRLQVTP